MSAEIENVLLSHVATQAMLLPVVRLPLLRVRFNQNSFWLKCMHARVNSVPEGRCQHRSRLSDKQDAVQGSVAMFTGANSSVLDLVSSFCGCDDDV